MSVSKYRKGVVNLVQDELQSIEMMMMTMIAVMVTLFSLHATCADAELAVHSMRRSWLLGCTAMFADPL